MYDPSLFAWIMERAVPSGECLVWTIRLTEAGYARCRVKGYGFDVLVHRAAYESVYGPIPHGLCVCHRCDNRPCVNVDHLFLGTRADNNADKLAKGRQARGYWMGPTQLLDVDDVRAIRADTRPSRLVAQEYGVNQSTVTRIRSRKRWAWVD